ncbi:MAG: hypothetical protein Kow0092_32740 [Deferrisomatales bacterium]
MPRTAFPRATMKTSSKIAGIVGAALAAAAWFVAAYYPTQKVLLWGLGALGAGALAFFFAAERRLLARAPTSRAAKYGANAAAMTLAFLGILVILNVLALRHNEKWDLTAQKLYTLSDQTRKVLDGLDEEVKVTAFFADGSEPRLRMKQLLDDLADESPRLRVSFVDPDKNPALANQYGIREYGTTVFESGSRSYRITETTEEAVTNALVRVTREERKTVCFLAGHGEHSVEDTQRSGYATAKKALEEQGYAVRELLLLREGEVPKACSVLVAGGPTKPLLDEEVDAVRGYLDAGGRGMLLLDPRTRTGVEAVAAQWGIEVHEDMIVDRMSRLFGGSYTTPIITEYPARDVTREFNLAAFLPLARSLAPREALPEGVSVRPVGRTTPQSWGETDLAESKATFDPSRDYKGPLVVAALAEKKGAQGKDPEGQLLVVGDSDFADNTYFHFSGNGDLFQNLVSYLAKEEDLISIRPKDARPSPLVLTRAQGATLFYGSVVVGPALLILAGLGIWWKRRNL